MRQGKSLEDARNGGASGCVESGAFGTEAYILTGYFNLVKVLEVTLHNGTDPLTGKQIGIKSGDMISGNIGSVSLKRLDYTVIGDTVNTAARFQDLAKENQIVIGQKCYEIVKESFNIQKIGEVVVKNKAKPLTIYEVLE